MNNIHNQTPSHQQGATLIISLLLLFIIGIGAKGIITSVRIDSQMNRNFEERDFTFQAAERALRIIENTKINNVKYIEYDFTSSCTGDTCFNNDCNNSLCKTVNYETQGGYNCTPEGTRAWEDEQQWNNANSINIDIPRANTEGSTNNQTVNVNVKYLIEFRCYIPRVANPQLEFHASEWLQYYRITVRAQGPSGSAQVTLQTTYQRG